jgi:ribosome maturation factor RimP
MALQLDTIRSTAERVAASHHLEVVDVEFSGGAKFRSLRVFIEKDAASRAALAAQVAASAAAVDAAEVAFEIPVLPTGVPVESLSGVTHEDCEHFARDFGTLLDVEDAIPGAEYTLEVSSPGLERKLTRPADFARFTGFLVKLQTFTAVEGNRHFQARLTAFDPTAQTIRIDPGAVKQKGKARKAAAAAAGQSIEIAFQNIEKANLIPEI